MVAVTICSDFGAQEKKSLSLFPLFPHLFAFSLSSFTFIKRLFSSSLTLCYFHFNVGRICSDVLYFMLVNWDLSVIFLRVHAEYIMRNAELDEAQAGIKIARRNTHNLRDADDTTRMGESEEEPKSFLMKVK